ncbi:TonB-dependent receptor [Aquimarina sp. U1-2]|uniref:SusC/RagA family TonB-linked outer membrane protein n=1 Tax=Aquimarina sp. U1-2 TaxID=2823141 RepID=UPI001AED1005|nr:TonB-dependent receptor [Aquimarina sp. U1-2]MBP2830677.1 TonB-dependent receptor [Aquimarina sp. U1-2]
MKKKLLRSNYSISKRMLRTLTITLFFVNLLIANHGKAQKYKSVKDVFVSVNNANMSIKNILKSIEKNTEFVFMYDKNDITSQNTIQLPETSLSVAKILQTISENTMLRFRQVNRTIDVRLDRSVSKPNTSIQNMITGTVTDENGMPLPGANILVKGTSNGAVSDFDGNYSIAVNSQSKILVFSYLGYETEEIEIKGRRVIDYSFKPDASALDEIVVVGYGTQSRQNITGSVSSLEEYRLENVPNTNFTQALQGSVSGVYITNNSAGAENADVNIRIRGQNSITANNGPLIVLDGVPFSGNISQINPNDIESLEVLKDVSSSAIYGTRGANGVILITTKKGKLGRTVINYNTYVGFQKATNVPNLMNGEEFYNFKLERLGGDPNNPETVFTPTELENYNNQNFTDWIDISTRTSIQQEHSISVSSGTEKTKVYLAGTFIDVEGIAKGDQFQRYNLQFNLDQKIKDWLTIGTNTRLNYINRDGIAVDLAGAFFLNPLTNPYEEDGVTPTVFPWPEDEFFGNPLERTLFENEDEEYSIFSNVYMNIDIPFIPGLSYKLNTGSEYSNRDRNTYRGRNTRTGLLAEGSSTNRQDRTRNFLLENILSYKKNFGAHSIDVTALYSSQIEDYQRFQLDARGFPNDLLNFYQAELANIIIPSNVYRKNTIISQMGRINYGYDSKYLLTLTARRDGFSGFGTNNKYAIFPSVGLAWNISRENFLYDSKLVNNLKLRLSYGQIGNQAIRPFRTLARLGPQNYLSGNNSSQFAAGFIPVSLGNADLGWETTTSFNAGLDFGFLNNRIRGSVEYYQSTTEDLLLNRGISAVQGIPSIVQNIGETENKGLELIISGDVIEKTNFSWSVDFNFSFNRNKILKLYGDGNDDIRNQWFIGQPIDVNYGLVFDGIWQEDEAAEAAVYNAVPGDVRIRDVNQDGEISRDDDREIFGNLQPDFIAGLGSTIKYKNWGLNFFIYTEQGVERPNSLLDAEVFLQGGRRNGVQREFWTPENPINTYPRNSEAGPTSTDPNPEEVRFVEDASFIRMRDVTLSYDFPSPVLETLGLSNFKLYGTVRNLFTITDWTGTDPEFQGRVDATQAENNDISQGFRQFSIPVNRTFIFGINVSL